MAAKIALQKETGREWDLEHCDTEQIETLEGWRGRAQQIAVLQAKLAAHHAPLSHTAPLPLHQPSSSVVVTSKFNDGVAIQQQHTHAQLKSLQAQLTSVTTIRDTYKNKLEAMTARKNILEGDVSALKNQMTIVLAKSDRDDLCIDELRHSLATTTDAHTKTDAVTAEKLTSLQTQCLQQQALIQSLQQQLAAVPPPATTMSKR